MHPKDTTSTRVEYIVDPESECWEWAMARDRHGYGVRRINNALFRAHRLIYERHRGPIPDGLTLDHLCRNRGCVNPDHLEPVPMVENLRRGASAKLNMELARQIREAKGKQREIAARFNVPMHAVADIKSGRRWRE